MNRARTWLLAALAVLAIAGCGGDPGSGAAQATGEPSGRLTLVHYDLRVTAPIPVEGALGVLRLTDTDGHVVYEGASSSSVPLRYGTGSVRHVLVEDLAVPEGMISVEFDVRICSLACPSIDDWEQLDHASREDTCRLGIPVDGVVEAVFETPEGQPLSACRLAA